jgi:hypothetical protein
MWRSTLPILATVPARCCVHWHLPAKQHWQLFDMIGLLRHAMMQVLAAATAEAIVARS